MRSSAFRFILACATTVHSITVWQQRNETFTVPDSPVISFSSVNLTTKSDALSALAAALGSNDTITYPGDRDYGATIARVWTTQRKTFPDAILYPQTARDVSVILQFYSSAYTLWGTDGFAIMGGGHADFGGAQSPSVIIDLRKLGTTEFATNGTESVWPILKIGGGSEAGDVYDTLDGTGWAFLGPRAASIGVGGFLLGGGIAFQTNRYGVANDAIVGVEIVLIDGSIVYANPYNEYSDLFWACTGAGFIGIGVISHFYVQAYPDPGTIYTGTITWYEDQAPQVFEKATEFFENNQDPDAFPGLVYYFKDPSNPTGLAPLVDRSFTLQLNSLYFGGNRSIYNETFSQFFEGASTITFGEYDLKTLDQYLLSNYPYGYDRLFYGKSHTNSTTQFYNETFGIYKETINGMITRGEDPGHTLWVDEYIFPGWNGAGPASDSETSWPHATSSHITLTSGEWSNSSTTEYMYDRDENYMMSYLRDFQAGYEEPAIYDYPNYIAPYSVNSEVWGTENFERLLVIKEKYDPDCLFNRGLVFNTTACVAKGVATRSLSN